MRAHSPTLLFDSLLRPGLEHPVVCISLSAPGRDPPRHVEDEEEDSHPDEDQSWRASAAGAVAPGGEG